MSARSAGIIVAAGRGRRMGFDKLLAPLCGKPVLQWSLDAFLEAQSIDCIVVVTDEERFAALELGARPLIQPAQIDQCLEVARAEGAAALARRVTETLKKADDNQFTQSAVERDELWIMETPQAFRFKMLRRAYSVAESRRLEVTDDVSAAAAIGVPSKLIENPLPNLKITVPQDLAVVEALMKSGLGRALEKAEE